MENRLLKTSTTKIKQLLFTVN